MVAAITKSAQESSDAIPLHMMAIQAETLFVHDENDVLFASTRGTHASAQFFFAARRTAICGVIGATSPGGHR